MTYLNTKEAAKHLNLSKNTLERMRVRGDGPQYVKLARAVRYRVTDLDEFMREMVVSSTSERGGVR